MSLTLTPACANNPRWHDGGTVPRAAIRAGANNSPLARAPAEHIWLEPTGKGSHTASNIPRATARTCPAQRPQKCESRKAKMQRAKGKGQIPAIYTRRKYPPSHAKPRWYCTKPSITLEQARRSAEGNSSACQAEGNSCCTWRKRSSPPALNSTP